MEHTHGFGSSLAAEREVLQAVVLFHEDQLASQGQAFFLRYPLPLLQQTIRHVASQFVQPNSTQTLEKRRGTHLFRLTVVAHNGTVKRLRLVWQEEGELSHLMVSVGLYAILHHGIEEVCGFVSHLQREQSPDIFSMRHRTTLPARSWKGVRWLCGNLLMWMDANHTLLPFDFD